MNLVVYFCCLPRLLFLKSAVTSHVTNPVLGQLDLTCPLTALSFLKFSPCWLPLFSAFLVPLAPFLTALFSARVGEWFTRRGSQLSCHSRLLSQVPFCRWWFSVSVAYVCLCVCPSRESEQSPCPHIVSDGCISSKAGARGMTKQHLDLELYPMPLTKADPQK